MIKLLLGAFFSASSLPIVKKVLIGLGFGIVSYTAVTTALNQVISSAQSSYGSMSSNIIAIAGLGGIGQALGIITGALIFRVSVVAVSKLALLPK